MSEKLSIPILLWIYITVCDMITVFESVLSIGYCGKYYIFISPSSTLKHYKVSVVPTL